MFKGSMPALITPFDPSGAVDETAFQSFVDWQVKQGSHGLVPVGTTGESPTLSHDEHKRVVELCVEAAAGRVPVLAGTGIFLTVCSSTAISNSSMGQSAIRLQTSLDIESRHGN